MASIRRTLPLLVALAARPNEPGCAELNHFVPSHTVEVSEPSDAFNRKLNSIVQDRAASEDSLPQVPISEEQWASAVGVRDAVARCVQGKGVVCNAEATDLTCFSTKKGDFLAAEIEIGEIHDPDWHYRAQVNPSGRESAAMVFSVGVEDPDRVDILRLVCDEARRITRPYIADWRPFCDSGMEDCDEWALGVFDETQSLRERWVLSRELGAALSSEGWPYERVNLFNFSIHYTGNSDRVLVGINWGILHDEPQFFTRIQNGWSQSDFNHCGVSECDAFNYARNLNLDSPIFPDPESTWFASMYGISYP